MGSQTSPDFNAVTIISAGDGDFSVVEGHNESSTREEMSGHTQLASTYTLTDPQTLSKTSLDQASLNQTSLNETSANPASLNQDSLNQAHSVPSRDEPNTTPTVNGTPGIARSVDHVSELLESVAVEDNEVDVMPVLFIYGGMDTTGTFHDDCFIIAPS